MWGKVKGFVAQACLTLCDHRGALLMAFSKREYWRGLPYPSSGDLPNPGIRPGSPTLQA